MARDSERPEAGNSPPERGVARPAEAPFRLGYRPELDGIRAIAILAVLLRHAPIPGWQRGVLWGGWIGVDIFFVLSGFLITTLLFREFNQASTISLRRFYARRALRLAPALIVMLVAWCGYSWMAFPEVEARRTCWQALVTLLYSTNWVQAYCLLPMDQLAPMWSLAVEEQFYLLWPLALAILLGAGMRTRGLLTILTIGVLLSAGARAVMFTGGECNLERLYNGSDTRADTLLVGCILGVLAVSGALNRIASYRRTFASGAVGSAGLLALVALTMPEARWQLYFGLFTVVALASATVIGWILCNPHSTICRCLASIPMVWVGRRSYGIYLWHAPIAVAVSTPLTVILAGKEPPWVLSLVTYLFCAFCVAAISFRYVERPLLDLKHRFESVVA